MFEARRSSRRIGGSAGPLGQPRTVAARYGPTRRPQSGGVLSLTATHRFGSASQALLGTRCRLGENQCVNPAAKGPGTGILSTLAWGRSHNPTSTAHGLHWSHVIIVMRSDIPGVLREAPQLTAPVAPEPKSQSLVISSVCRRLRRAADPRHHLQTDASRRDEHASLALSIRPPAARRCSGRTTAHRPACADTRRAARTATASLPGARPVARL